MKRNFILACIVISIFTCFDILGQVTIGSGEKPAKAALLELKTQPDANPAQGGVTSTGGGLLLPRVVLEDIKSLKPFIADGGSNTEKVSHKGMNVYHIGGNGIDAGQYVWDGAKWLRLLTDVPPLPIITSVIKDLQTPAVLPLTSSEHPEEAVELDFGELEILESGAYAVTLRLYGFVFEQEVQLPLPYPLPQLTKDRSTSVYIWLYRSGSPIAVDAAEMTLVALEYDQTPGLRDKNSPVVGINASLTVPWVDAGEKLTIKASTNYNSDHFYWVLYTGSLPRAARSSMFYWKL